MKGAAQTGIGLAALAALCIVTPASAEDCKPLRMVASLPTTDTGRDNVVTVPVSLDGVEKHFLFDTGGFFTQVSSSVADELKLVQRQSTNLVIYGSDGTLSRNVVFVPDFAIGPLHGKDYEIPVSPISGFDGIFSPVTMKSVDFEMDFTAHKINLFSPDHCDGNVIYWPFKAAAGVPFVVDNSKHLTVPVTIDGHNLKAIIDTGATFSIVRLNRAELIFDLHPGSPDMTVIGHVGNDEQAPIFEHQFHTLSFGDITVTNPHIHIYTDIVNKNADHAEYVGNRAQRDSDDITLPDVTVGMDVLRKLHLYLALKEGKLYFTEASAPAAAAGPTAQPASPAQSK